MTSDEDPEFTHHVTILATDIEILVLGEVLQAIDKAFSKADAVAMVISRIRKAGDRLKVLTAGETMLAATTAKYYTTNGGASDHDT